MASLLEWLLELENIELGRDAPLLLKWNSHVEAWMLFCVALPILAYVAFIYRREDTSVAKRIILAVTRCATIALLVAVICQPSLVLQRNRIEKAHVALLVDSSKSMGIAESYSDRDLADKLVRGTNLGSLEELEAVTRMDLLKKSLTRDMNAPLKSLSENNALLLATFADGSETVAFTDSVDDISTMASQIDSLTSEGARSDLVEALRRVMDRSQGRRIAAIVLATDGQATDAANMQAALLLAKGRQIPIYPVRIGSPEPRCDVEVGVLRADEKVFVNDVLAIEAEISVRGLQEPSQLEVVLSDDRTGKVLDKRTVSVQPSPEPAVVELQTKPTRTGIKRYRVEVPALPSERFLENNKSVIDVQGLDQQLRILYVDGYPRYEYRYIKNALVREPTMTASVLLLGADEQFVQEGTDRIRRFPESPEELNRYDVVLFGDVDPRGGWLSQAQMKMMLDYVGNEGGGFGVIAGERYAPQRFLGTPLEKLLPVRIDPMVTTSRPVTASARGFHVRLTPEGRRNRIFRAAPALPFSEQEEGVPKAELFENLPELYWVATTLGPRPGATVLAEHPTQEFFSAGNARSNLLPVVVVGRYGAGRTFFQATDDTWRWRRHQGELLHDAYWVQVMRHLMRSDRIAHDRRFAIHADRRIYEYGQTVRVQIEVFDAKLLTGLGESISLVVEDIGNKTNLQAEANEAGSGASAVVIKTLANRLTNESKRFEANFVPPYAGTFEISLHELLGQTGSGSASTTFRVDQPDVEARKPEADHEMLSLIAETTGGRMLDLDELAIAFGAFKDRSVLIPDDISEPLWDSRLVMILFVMLISFEWIVRKSVGLL